MMIGRWTVRYFIILDCRGEYGFYYEAVSFGREISKLILMKFVEN